VIGKREKVDNSEVKSILAEGLKVEGNIIAQGKIRIDGEVNGDVKGEVLIFGKPSVVKGNISAKKVVLMGELQGNLSAESAEVKSSARVKGDLTVKELLVEPGASIDGSLKVGEFLSKEVETQKKK